VLDLLAQDLAANHYDLKKTMERIVTSRAYQLPAVASGETRKPAYQFRGPEVRRLSAEQFRDALAQLTGVWCERPELPGHGTNTVRASLVPADGLTTALGRPNREQVCTARPAAATTLQALELANGHTLSQLLERGAERLLADNPSPEQLIPKLYQTALGRAPSTAEVGVARELAGEPVTKEGLEDLLWAVSMLPEFQFIY
jgi:hypothetical protein